MPVGSLDSGLGGDVDDGRASRTRSSSEEKESLTPAQSRRKAQNRAAYVFLIENPVELIVNFDTASALFASARNDT
jgi:hypothetical protein